MASELYGGLTEYYNDYHDMHQLEFGGFALGSAHDMYLSDDLAFR